MTFIYNGSDNYVDDVRLRSATDQVKGGLNNPANVASQDLADCATFLKAQDIRDMQAQVEAASGGTATIRVDGANLIDYFYIMEKFKPSDLDSDMGIYSGITGWSGREYHPAFYVNGTLKDRILFSIFSGNVETISSTEYMKQSINTNPLADEYAIAQIRLMCSNKGTGYHLMNYLEHSAASLMSLDSIAELKGNDNNGTTYGTTTNNSLRGRPYNPAAPDVTYAGSGPLEWRHNHQPWGIADLVGNIGEVLDGIYTNLGQIYMFSTRDNYYTESEVNYTATGIFYDKQTSPTNLILNNAQTGTTFDDRAFQDLLISAALKASANELIDSSYITDTLICKQWNKTGTLTTPALIGTNDLGTINGRSLTTKAYVIAGGSYNYQNLSLNKYGPSGIATRDFESDSGILHGRCCLIE
jgi:hypothetical protein